MQMRNMQLRRASACQPGTGAVAEAETRTENSPTKDFLVSCAARGNWVFTPTSLASGPLLFSRLARSGAAEVFSEVKEVRIGPGLVCGLGKKPWCQPTSPTDRSVLGAEVK